MIRAITSWITGKRIQRVPFVQQYEEAESGVAALSALMRYWGVYKSLAEIRINSGIGCSEASDILNIQKAAQIYGFDVTTKQITATELITTSLTTPCILLCKDNQIVVCEGVTTRGRFAIADPANGRYTLDRDGLCRLSPQVSLLMNPGIGFKKEGKPENELLTIIRYLAPFQSPIALCLAMATLLIIPNAANPGLSDTFVNEFILNQRYDYGIPILWLSVFMLGITAWINLINFNVLRRIMLRLQRRLTLAISTKVLCVDYTFFATRYRGDIASRVLLGLEVGNSLTQQILSFVLAMVGAILMIPIVILISWQLSAATLLYISTSLLIAVAFGKSLSESNNSMQIELGKLGGLIVQMVNETETIKSTGLERPYLARWLNIFAPILEKKQHDQIRIGVMNALTTLIDSVYEYGTIVLAGLLVLQGKMDLAGFMAFQVIRGQVITPLLGLNQLVRQLKDTEAAIERLSDLFSVQRDPRVHSLDLLHGLFEKPGRKKLLAVTSSQSTHPEVAMPPLQSNETGMLIRTIQINSLAHRFSPQAPYVLKDISFRVPAGSMLTIVGLSGAGKSTLIKLITGLYTVVEGEILYENHAWLSYPDAVIRKAIGYVSQEVSGMRGTIEENITLWQPGYCLDEIREAAKLACFDEVAMASRYGYRTVLQDGAEGLSGGELQRLELSRALLKKPSVLVLDEATSALDVPTEIEVLNNLRDLGITLVCVAHRLITAEMSDQVLVLENGEITGLGTPNQLQQNNELYKRLKEAEVTQ